MFTFVLRFIHYLHLFSTCFFTLKQLSNFLIHIFPHFTLFLLFSIFKSFFYCLHNYIIAYITEIVWLTCFSCCWLNFILNQRSPKLLLIKIDSIQHCFANTQIYYYLLILLFNIINKFIEQFYRTQLIAVFRFFGAFFIQKQSRVRW